MLVDFLRQAAGPTPLLLVTLKKSNDCFGYVTNATMYGGIRYVTKFHHSMVELEVTLEMIS